MDKSQEIRSGIIYKFTNNINGHSYIGQTINPKSRYQDHLGRVKKNTGLDTAIAKYGAENFSYEVLYETPALPCYQVKELLNEKEIYYINKYDTYNNGYNQTLGGKGTVGMPCSEKSKEFRKWYNAHRNELLSDETREKLRINAILNKDKMHSVEARKKMSDKNIFIQKSEESIQKMKDSLKGRSTRQGVKINFYDGDELIKQFDSRKECFAYFEKQISKSTIKNMLVNNIVCKKYSMYRLEYADNKDHHIKQNMQGQKIIQLTLDNQLVKVWDSLAECVRETGYSKSVIIKVCKHLPHSHSYKGFIWMYENEYKQNN